MDISLGRRFLLTSVKYGIPTYLSLSSLKVSCPNPAPMRHSRKPLKRWIFGGGTIYVYIYTLDINTCVSGVVAYWKASRNHSFDRVNPWGGPFNNLLPNPSLPLLGRV